MRVRMVVMDANGEVIWAEDSTFDTLDVGSMKSALDCGWYAQVQPLADDESPLPPGGVGHKDVLAFAEVVH